MTKKEIVKTISDDCGLTQLKTKEIVQKTFEAIIETLVQDPRHRIELRNFGVFEVKKRAARKARNPRTGDRVEVPAKFVVTFKPGKEMEEQVLRLEQEEIERERQRAEASRIAKMGTSVATETSITPKSPITTTAPLHSTIDPITNTPANTSNTNNTDSGDSQEAAAS
ncbi:MAG: HU family DNA-binding protein [Planctomycetaceae bacterium]